jgi:hypothetical protein
VRACVRVRACVCVSVCVSFSTNRSKLVAVSDILVSDLGSYFEPIMYLFLYLCNLETNYILHMSLMYLYLAMRSFSCSRNGNYNFITLIALTICMNMKLMIFSITDQFVCCLNTLLFFTSLPVIRISF